MAIEAYRPYSIFHTTRPGIFLAGPIQGAPNWQQEALDTIATASDKRGVDLDVFNPRVEEFNAQDKGKQIYWEKTYLKRARDHGVILFWFAAQDHSIDSYPVGRSYAQTSRIEFGRTMGWLDYNPQVKMVVGIDAEYEGGNVEYIRDCAEEYALPIHEHLGRLCMHAVDLARQDVKK